LVALYARVSTDQQAHDNTIASQLDALRRRIAADGCQLHPDGQFIDEGYSGSDLLRPALERLRDAAAAGLFTRLYVGAPDRLARDYVLRMVLLEELRRCGVEVVFLNRPLADTPEDRMLEQLQGIIAEYERTQILERCRRGKRLAARQGRLSVLVTAAYGYRYVSKADGGGQARLVVVLEEAKVVQQIFRWVAEDRLSLSEVCRRLAEQGVPTRKGQGRWRPSTLRDMLRNPIYKGEARYGKTRTLPRRAALRPRRGQAAYPRRSRSVQRCPDEETLPIPVVGLVSAELFAAANEQLRQNRRNHPPGPSRYLLQGLTVCKRCGYAYCARAAGHRTSKGSYSYFVCLGSQKGHFGGQAVCANRPVRTDRLEEAVWADVCALLSHPDKIEEEYRRRLERQPPEAGASELLRKQVQAVQTRMRRLVDLYADGLLERDQLASRLQGARRQLADLQGQQQQQAAQQQQHQELRLVIGQLRDFAERVRQGLDTADFASRQQIVRALVRRIEIDTEEIRVVYKVNPPPFDLAPFGGRSPLCTGLGKTPPAATTAPQLPVYTRPYRPRLPVLTPPGSPSRSFQYRPGVRPSQLCVRPDGQRTVSRPGRARPRPKTTRRSPDDR
jgi:site-specific DNA recombinase